MTRAERGVLLLAAVLFLWFLWGHDFWAPDEPTYAEVAREMLVDGHWLVPHLNGLVYTHKPPLFFWLIALFSAPFGTIPPFVARLPSALAALGTLMIVMRLSRRWYGAHASAVAGLVLATSVMFWDKARWVQIDSLLCFLIWSALWAFVAFREGKVDGFRAGLLFWTASALAVLAKGPIGLVLPLAICLITLTWERNLSMWKHFTPIAGPALFMVICCSWAVPASIFGAPDYSLIGSLRENFVERGFRGLHHPQPFWYYGARIPTFLLPWTGLLPGALFLAWNRRQDLGTRMAFVTVAFVTVFFSLSSEKRDLYALPAFPAFAILMAALVASVCGWGQKRIAEPTLDKRWITIGHGLVGAFFSVLGIYLPFAVAGRDDVPFAMALAFAAILFLTGASMVVASGRGRVTAAILASAVGMSCLYIFSSAVVYPALNSRKSARAFALKVKAATADSREAGNRVVAWETANLPETFAFFSDGMYIVHTEDAEVVAGHLRQEKLVYALVWATELDQVPVDSLESAHVIDETVLSRRHILLITNRPHGEGTPLSEHPTYETKGSKPRISTQ